MLPDQIPWRDRVFVTIAEAGQIFARSPAWVRDRASEGRLELANVSRGGPLVVTVASVAALVDELTPDAGQDAPAEPKRWPTLVWINPAPLRA